MMFRLCPLIPLLWFCVLTVDASPTTIGDCLNILSDNGTTDEPSSGGLVSPSNLTENPLDIHHVERRNAFQRLRSSNGTARSTHPAEGELAEILRLPGDILRLPVDILRLPVDLLRLLQKVTVPVVDASFAMPASLLEQLGGAAVIGEVNGEAIITSLAALPGNASRWLHSGSSSHNGTGLDGSSSGLNGTSTSNDLHGDANSKRHPSLFNATKAGNAARTAALFGERLLLTPVTTLLAALTNPVGLPGHPGSLPPTLHGDHLQRHLAQLRRFLGAARGPSSTTPPPASTTPQPSTTPQESASSTSPPTDDGETSTTEEATTELPPTHASA